MDATTIIANESLVLCPERAVWWPRRRLLFVADPHFGKAATFRALGVHVPKGTTESAFVRLDRMIDRMKPAQITFLGDFLHAKEGRNAETFDAIAAWRRRHAAIEMQIVRGNHDKRAGDPPTEVGIACVDGPVMEGPFALAHHPVSVGGSYVFAGHVHPCAKLAGPARQWERLACFWFGADVGVLPAFGDFTGCAEIAAAPTDHVWVIGDDAVFPLRN